MLLPSFEAKAYLIAEAVNNVINSQLGCSDESRSRPT